MASFLDESAQNQPTPKPPSWEGGFLFPPIERLRVHRSHSTGGLLEDCLKKLLLGWRA